MFHLENETPYAWAIQVIYKNKKYECYHIYDTNKTKIYLINHKTNNMFLQLIDSNITPLNFVAKLPMLLTFK